MREPSTWLPSDMGELFTQITDPVERLLLTGAAKTVFEAEQMYLDAAYLETLALLASPLVDDELAEHPLFRLYRFYGSPAREDSLQ